MILKTWTVLKMNPLDDPTLESKQPPMTDYPTEEHIASECKKIQAGWNTTTQRSRTGCSVASKTEMKVIRLRDFLNFREIPDS
jgi:hypothetical protein